MQCGLDRVETVDDSRWDRIDTREFSRQKSVVLLVLETVGRFGLWLA